MTVLPTMTEMPEGWAIIEGAMTQPRGHVWISNRKSMFSKDRKIALLKLSEKE